MAAATTPDPQTFRPPPGEQIPNNPRFPVLIYHGVPAALEVAAIDPRCRAASRGSDLGA
jgi:uncharacterized protein YjlB